MAVVTAGFIPRNRGLNAAKAGAKDNVKYIQFRPGKDQEGITRTLFGSDGRMERREAYQFIDEAPKGTVFFTIIISPDPKTEDHHRDLDMRAIADTTMQTLEAVVKPYWRLTEGLAKQRSWDHTPTNLITRCGGINHERRLSLSNRFDR
jgi:hypothetical protein